jgi:hypothetical protein
MFNIKEFNAMLDSPCMFHKGATYTIRECSQFKTAFRILEVPKRPRGDGDRSSSRRYSYNRWNERRDEQQPEDYRDERDLPPPPAMRNPIGSSRPRGRSTRSLAA